MAQWPTADDLRTFSDFGQIPFNGSNPSDEARGKALAAATDTVRGLLYEPLMPAEGDEHYPCPDGVHYAILLLGARLASRKNSPGGVIGSGELLVQIRREDPDVHATMTAYALPDIVNDLTV